MSSSLRALSLVFVVVPALLFLSEAAVPKSETFKFVNEGEFGDYIVEYDGNYRVLSIATTPFQLCFYNTTPNAFTLALRMGTVRSESLMRWVWEANRGNPVREKATLTFGSDGNLVLADADGRVAWQTGTANKGVVAFRLLPNGNMVLLDSKGKFVWQSFDSPTDTFLVGQSFRAGSTLVGRASAEKNYNGSYSMVLGSKGLAWYYKGNNSPKPYLYYMLDLISRGTLEYVTFSCEPETEEAYAYELRLGYHLTNSTADGGGTQILSRPKYNSTLTYMRLGIDGNLRLFTFYDKVDYGAWEETYTLFRRNSGDSDECGLPERCGKFGLCEDSQCVACPTPSGLAGWSESCEAQRVTSCKPSEFKYYKLEGVENFVTKYTKGSGPVKDEACRSKCTSDCKCLGYFYNQDSSRCWVAYELMTLTRVGNSTHLAYIKAPIH